MKLDASLLQRAIPDGSMRYFAWLYTPQEHRDAMAALFLLEAELRDTARAPHDVAHIRLQWWRDEIANLSKGKAQHPATQILQSSQSVATDFSILDALILCTAQDIAHSTCELETELQQYMKNYGSLMKLAATLLNNSPTTELLESAEKIGAFIRTVETLRDLRNDIHHGLLYLPLNELDKLNVEYETLDSREWPAAFTQWLRSRCDSVLNSHTQLRNALLKSETSQLRPLLVLAAQHEKLLALLAKDVANFDHRLELKLLSKLWTSWRAAIRT